MLLTKKKRKAYFEKLGLGEYNKENIKKLQKKYLRKCDVDGVYGTDTDRLLRHLYNVKTYTKNFKPEEFKCECGGKHCTGYPTFMRKDILVQLQALRDKTKVETTVTSGIRCKKYNSSCVGSDPNSYHTKGKAVDCYSSKTNTLTKRKSLINWLKPKIRFAYCDGYDTYGQKRYAPYMGTSIHFEVK